MRCRCHRAGLGGLHASCVPQFHGHLSRYPRVRQHLLDFACQATGTSARADDAGGLRNTEPKMDQVIDQYVAGTMAGPAGEIDATSIEGNSSASESRSAALEPW